jgi:hypothetical protein
VCRSLLEKIPDVLTICSASAHESCNYVMEKIAKRLTTRHYLLHKYYNKLAYQIKYSFIIHLGQKLIDITENLCTNPKDNTQQVKTYGVGLGGLEPWRG